MEFDPINNFDMIIDDERLDPTYVKYWRGKNKCKPCRMKYVPEIRDFVDDCGYRKFTVFEARLQYAF